VSNTGLILAALGGPQTFGAQAARLICDSRPEYTEMTYYRTADDALDAILRGEADAFCAPEQMSNTGFHAGMHLRMTAPDSRLYVVADMQHAYHCSLLGKPGAELAQVRRVLGHTGSITQSRTWLETHLPEARIEIVDTSSLGAGNTVLTSDGSIASVGTIELADQLGLVELAKEIDGGSVASYWALSREPRFSAAPTCVVVAGIGRAGELGALIAEQQQAGFQLATVSSHATGAALFEYHYLLRFRGAGRLEAVQLALQGFSGMRLAGAFVADQ
jgi:prephenate dehydratase